MLYDLDLDAQRKRFANVIEHLSYSGNKKKEIASRIGLSPYDISHLLSGKLINITDDVLENLHKEFGVNPNYIRKGATNMFDIPGIKYENFESFVDSWDLVEHENKEYLHFTMDENFYKFLIKIYNMMEASTQKSKDKILQEAFVKAFESLKGNFSDSERPKEYVLIPADDMMEIATENVARRKSLNEVIKILNLDTPKEKPIKIKGTELE